MRLKPTFVFVHGAWHQHSFFDNIRARLAEHGYNSVAPHLPSVGTTPPVESMELDVKAVKDTVTSLLSDGKDVICVAHSYGGTVLTEAIGTLDVYSLQTHDAYLKHLVYVAAMIPKQGQRQIDVAQDAPQPENPVPVYYRWEEGMAYAEPNAVDVFYQDETPNVQAELMANLRPQSIASVTTPVTDCGWRYVPSSYVFTLDDAALPYSSQQYIVDDIRKASDEEGRVIKPFSGPLGTSTIRCGHCAPFVSKAEDLTRFLIQIAEIDS